MKRQSPGEVSCQFSLYPLRQERITPTLEAVVRELDQTQVDYEVGSMSTLLHGDEEHVFQALRRAFHAAAVTGDAVLVATISNGCPAKAD
ncbi:MAG: YkoF family thiamine/hydroxymethylpyrimidine-binding protein [Chloroflexota bacterium]